MQRSSSQWVLLCIVATLLLLLRQKESFSPSSNGLWGFSRLKSCGRFSKSLQILHPHQYVSQNSPISRTGEVLGLCSRDTTRRGDVLTAWRPGEHSRSEGTWLSASISGTSASPEKKFFSRFRRSLHRVLNFPSYKLEQISSFFRVQLPLLSYLWPKDSLRLRSFLLLSLAFMFLGKWFGMKVPFLLQRAVDSIASTPQSLLLAQQLHPVKLTSSLSLSVGAALILYGIARAVSVICAEIKTCLFVHVTQNVLCKFANQVFTHLHSLDSAFHLRAPSGVISVAYVRAVRGFQALLFQLVFSVAPTALELTMVSSVLYKRFSPIFAGITLLTFTVYLIFTVIVTQWRVELRQQLVQVDNARNGFFIDSLLNHEMVKLFTSEDREAQRFDSYLQRIRQLSIDSTYAIAVLNFGQAFLFCIGLSSSLLLSLHRVKTGIMSVGDLVAVNSMLLQLSIPFNFMGYTYQELRQSFVDMQYMRDLLSKEEPAVKELPGAVHIDELHERHGPSTLQFRNVSFLYTDINDQELIAYDSAPNGSNDSSGSGEYLPQSSSTAKPKISLLRDISFTINAGENVAIVGPSGSGKSTTLKLITRMLDPDAGSVLLDGIDLKKVTLSSLRQRVAVIPQDTCLFDETVEYNIIYGQPNATRSEINRVIDQSNLRPTIDKLARGLDTRVGERGARLSGGERQKVAIARALLRNPSLILCDEVTSSVDAFAEREITETLSAASKDRTTVTVAHRLSSVMHCDRIIVLQGGRVVEQGTHEQLLQGRDGPGIYRKMWCAQNSFSESCDVDYETLEMNAPQSEREQQYEKQQNHQVEQAMKDAADRNIGSNSTVMNDLRANQVKPTAISQKSTYHPRTVQQQPSVHSVEQDGDVGANDE